MQASETRVPSSPRFPMQIQPPECVRRRIPGIAATGFNRGGINSANVAVPTPGRSGKRRHKQARSSPTRPRTDLKPSPSRQSHQGDAQRLDHRQYHQITTTNAMDRPMNASGRRAGGGLREPRTGIPDHRGRSEPGAESPFHQETRCRGNGRPLTFNRANPRSNGLFSELSVPIRHFDRVPTGPLELPPLTMNSRPRLFWSPPSSPARFPLRRTNRPDADHAREQLKKNDRADGLTVGLFAAERPWS